ncbi:hypothetical protein [Streptomyces sp. C]|nr:hypothetical protein [Streptomyces sp. C]
MTSNTSTALAQAAGPLPAWLHLLVMAFALVVLVATLARHR